jgi:hypothetical protein
MMTQLNHLTDAPFKCGPGDMDVAAFVKAVAIIGGHDAVEEFLAYSLWPLSESCEFGVDKMVTPLSKVVVPMPKVTPIIGK